MPKDEFDFDDPMELHGMEFPCDTDTTDAMGECFVEEFYRLGYPPTRILALFRNPGYTGMHRVMEQRGEDYVRELIESVAARWGRQVNWAVTPNPVTRLEPIHLVTASPPAVPKAAPTDPLGGPVPDLV